MTKPVPSPKSRGDVPKHLPLIEQAGSVASRFSVCKRYSTVRTSARRKTVAGTMPPSPSLAPPSKGLRPSPKVRHTTMVIPVYERAIAGVYYNTAAVLDHDGTYLGKYRKFTSRTRRVLGKVLLQARQPRTSCFKLSSASPLASTSATIATSPKVRAHPGLHGAEIVFNPSATVAGLSQYLWKLEQPAHAVANGYYMGCINRVGTESPWNIGKFYGTSYFVDPAATFCPSRAKTKTS